MRLYNTQIFSITPYKNFSIMSNKLIIIILFFILSGNTNYAQQNECPQFEWVESIKYHVKGTSGGAKGYSSPNNMKYLKDSEGNYILAFILSVNNVDTYTLTLADSVIPIEYRDKAMYTNLFIAKLDKDHKLLWLNSLNLIYDSTYLDITFGHIDLGGLSLDSKGNVYICGEANGTHNNYTLKIDNKSFVLNYHSGNPLHGYRDGFLLKLNRADGKAFWLKQLKGVEPLDLQMSQNDSLYLAFITNKDTIKFENHQLIQSPTSGIAKLDALGELQWVNWGSILAPFYTIGGISNFRGVYKQKFSYSIDEEENIYVSGLIDSNALVKISHTGQKLWERTYSTYLLSSTASVVYNNNYVYITMYLTPGVSIPNPYDFGNGNIVNIANNGSVFLWQLDANTGQTVSASKMWDNLSDSTTAYIHTLTADQNGYLYIAGRLGGKDSIQLGDSVYYITPTTHINDYPADAFVSKILAPAEGMGDVKFLWTVRSEGTSWESAVVPQTSANGKEHYFYGMLGGGSGKYGKHQFADTFYHPQNGLLHNEVSYVFGKINTDCSLPTEEITNPLQSVTVYPNPAQTQLTISNLPPNSTISITDISGRVLYTEYNKANSTVYIPLNCYGHLSVGMYFVQITNGAYRVNKKVVVGK